MKRTKRFFALFLALMMSFSIMAVTAAAYGEEEHVHTDACGVETIMPRKPSAMCGSCGMGMTEIGVRHDTQNDVYYVRLQCKNPNCTNRTIVEIPF